MGYLRPVAMAKVGFVGLKSDRETILAVLHDRGVVQVEPLRKEALHLFHAESATDVQRRVADQLLRVRGVRSALPRPGPTTPRSFASREELLEAAERLPIVDRVTALKREEDRLLADRKTVTDREELLTRFSFFPGPLEDLHLPHVLGFFGEAPAESYPALRADVSALARALFLEQRTATTVRFVVAVDASQAEAVGRLAQQRGVVLAAAPALAGPIAENLPALARQRAETDRRLAELRAELATLAGEWYGPVASLEEALAIENRKLEVWGRMGAGASVFALEGWVPVRARPGLEAALASATGGRCVLYDVPTTETPPTLMDNPPFIRRFEFFIRFYSLPQSNEWDPTFVFAFAFPLFFGFMLSDIGYGLVILAFSVWMIEGFPGRTHVPGFLKRFLTRIMSPAAMQSLAWTLLPGAALAIVFGWFSNEFFGPTVSLPGPHWDIRTNLGDLFLVAGFIGLAMVTLGFVLGALQAHYLGHRKEMVSRLAGVALAWGLTFLGLQLISRTFQRLLGPLGAGSVATDVEIALIVAGLLSLIVVEGAQGILGLTEVLSHILSYLRLVGILLSSVVIAELVNSVGGGLVRHGVAGSLVLGGLLGLILIVGGQLFNVVLAVFEPGIQGARLIFVEHFSKFYTGNGKPFRPFGSAREHTIATHAGPDPAPGRA